MSFFDNDDIIKRDMTDSFAVIDLSMGGHIVLSINNTNEHSKTDEFWVRITQSFEKELNKVIFSYETRPILLSDKESVVFVVTGFTASSGMYLAAAPSVSHKAIAFAVQSDMLGDILVFGELPAFTRVSKRMREEAQLLKEWLCNLERCFGQRGENDSSVFAEMLRDRISYIARYVGVDARTVKVGQIKEKENFDFGLFVSFVTVMLMLVRGCSNDNSVMVSIGEDGHGIFVGVDFYFEDQDLRYTKEMLIFQGMASRKRLLFEAIDKNKAMSIKFSPIIEDWSLLEVKVPDNEETEFELT